MLLRCLSRGGKQHSSPWLRNQWTLWLPSMIVLSLITETESPPVVVHRVQSPPVVAVVKPASSRIISQLEARILALEQRDMDAKRIHRDIQQLKGDIGSLKNSRALTHHLLRTTKEEGTQNAAALDDKIETLKKESRRVEDAVMTLGELQKTLGDRMKKMGDAQTASGLTLAMLSQANKNMRASLRTLATSSADHKTGLAELRKKITELEVRFAGLSADVMEKVANVDTMVGPELQEIRSSQTNLAQSLSLLTKKMMLLSPKVPMLQRQLSANTGKVESLARSLGDFRKEIHLIVERVGLTEEQLKSFVDPASEVNTERRRLITKLRAEVSLLQDGQEKLKTDQIAEMADRTKMYKQIAGLRVSRKILVEKVAELEDAVDHFTRDLRRLIVEGPRSKVVGHILSRQESALQALKSLRQAQLEIRGLLQQHGTAIAGNHVGLAANEDHQEADRAMLNKVQTRLVELFHRLQALQKDMATSADILRLDRDHEDTSHAVDGLTATQSQLETDLAHYASRIKVAEARLDNHGGGMQQMGAELDTLRRRTQQLHAAVKWKVDVHDKVAYDATLRRLMDLRNKQEDVATILNDYGTAMSHTRAELAAQRHAHHSTQLTTDAIRERLNHLHHNVALANLASHTRHGELASQAARLRNMIGTLGHSMDGYRHALTHTQQEVGRQHSVSVALSAKHAALLHKLHALQNTVLHLREAMSQPKDRSEEIRQGLALHQAQEDIRRVAQELNHYRHALAATHAAVSHQNDQQAQSSLTVGQLWRHYQKLRAQLKAMDDNSGEKAIQDKLEAERIQELHDFDIKKARDDIDTIAGKLNNYRDELNRTQAVVDAETRKRLLADAAAQDMRRQLSAQHRHMGDMARAMYGSKVVWPRPRLAPRRPLPIADIEDDDDLDDIDADKVALA